MRLNYAAALGQTGRMADVITQFSAAEQLGPLGAEALGPLVLRSRRPAGLTTQSRVTNVRSSSHPARPPRTTTTAFCSRACDAPVRAPSTCAAALRTDAAIVAARVNLANILLLSGKTSEAISEYAIAERLRPDDAQIGANLARARALR